jgi:hypothetical protein
MIRGHSTRSGVSLAPARGLSLDTTARPSPRGEGRALASHPRSRPGLVELTGFEPATPWLQTRCSPS